jgi:hypothetical protein
MAADYPQVAGLASSGSRGQQPQSAAGAD